MKVFYCCFPRLASSDGISFYQVATSLFHELCARTGSFSWESIRPKWDAWPYHCHPGWATGVQIRAPLFQSGHCLYPSHCLVNQWPYLMLVGPPALGPLSNRRRSLSCEQCHDGFTTVDISVSQNHIQCLCMCSTFTEASSGNVSIVVWWQETAPAGGGLRELILLDCFRTWQPISSRLHDQLAVQVVVQHSS